MFSRKINQFSIAAAASAVLIFLIMISAQDAYALSDPVTDENGITTWDLICFGHYPQSSDGKGGFKKEPIKWRVLDVEGNDAFIISDRNIDAMPYCEPDDDPKYDCLWHESTIRSWLNGYAASENKKRIDYSSDNFISKAFTRSELGAVKTTEVSTYKYTDWHYNWTDEHYYSVKTKDKVYMLDFYEMLEPKYGFTDSEEETVTRVALNTAYTAAGGSSGDKYRSPEGVSDSWLLRSPGEYSMYCDFITEEGEYNDIQVDGNSVQSAHGIRPVLHIDLKKTDVWSEAGQYTARLQQTIRAAANYSKKYDDAPFDLGASCTGDGILKYSSDDEDVASVDSTGKVTINGAGTAVITVTAPETDIYAEAFMNVVVNVDGEDQEIIVPADKLSMTYGDAPAALGAEAKTEIVYSSDNEKVASVDEAGNVKANGGGTCTITVKARARGQYRAAYKYVTVTVAKAATTVRISKSRFTLRTKALKKKSGAVKLAAKAGSGGKITWSGRASGKSKKALKLNGKTGKITVRKGTKKGRYTIKVTAKAAATARYKAASRTVKVTIRVK